MAIRIVEKIIIILKNVENGSKTIASENNVVIFLSSWKNKIIIIIKRPDTNTHPTLSDLEASKNRS